MFDIKDLKRYDVIPRREGNCVREKECKDGKWIKFEDIEEKAKPPMQDTRTFPGMRGFLEACKLPYTRDLD